MGKPGNSSRVGFKVRKTQDLELEKKENEIAYTLKNRGVLVFRSFEEYENAMRNPDGSPSDLSEVLYDTKSAKPVVVIENGIISADIQVQTNQFGTGNRRLSKALSGVDSNLDAWLESIEYETSKKGMKDKYSGKGQMLESMWKDNGIAYGTEWVADNSLYSYVKYKINQE